MLTYSQIQEIARMLNWSIQDVESSIAQLNGEFMKPDVSFFKMCMIEFEDGSINDDPGFYHRLSAPGYLDCTDWSGPFETEEEAVADMLQTYAD